MGEPSAALNLGFNLAALRKELDSLLIKSQPVIDALDLAMQVLFPFTIRLTEGKLTRDEEQMLNALGIKF